jgi:hypothetical protein
MTKKGVLCVKSEDFYDEIATLYETIKSEYDIANSLHKAHPQIPMLYCNKFVADWMKQKRK